jgi:ureidoglycolate hydrolase
MKIFDVPIRPVTPATFEGFGRIVRDFAAERVEIVTWPQPSRRRVEPGTGFGGGVTQGDFKMHWSGDCLHAHNHAVDGRYVTGWACDPSEASTTGPRRQREYLLTHEANYHPDGGQVFYPRDGKPFVALLAKPTPDDNVRPEDFVAFYCPGDFGIQILPGVWHQPLFPVEDEMTFDDKQGAVHACIRVDFVEEFGTYLKVPLKLTR